jgi:hypothetical protein
MAIGRALLLCQPWFAGSHQGVASAKRALTEHYSLLPVIGRIFCDSSIIWFMIGVAWRT